LQNPKSTAITSIQGKARSSQQGRRSKEEQLTGEWVVVQTTALR
jgi:hypothetical protein